MDLYEPSVADGPPFAFRGRPLSQPPVDPPSPVAQARSGFLIRAWATSAPTPPFSSILGQPLTLNACSGCRPSRSVEPSALRRATGTSPAAPGAPPHAPLQPAGPTAAQCLRSGAAAGVACRAMTSAARRTNCKRLLAQVHLEAPTAQPIISLAVDSYQSDLESPAAVARWKWRMIHLVRDLRSWVTPRTPVAPLCPWGRLASAGPAGPHQPQVAGVCCVASATRVPARYEEAGGGPPWGASERALAQALAAWL